MKTIFYIIIIAAVTYVALLLQEIHEDKYRDKLIEIENIEFPVIVLFEYKDSWALQDLVILKDNNGDSCFVRNEKIAEFMRRMNICEEMGSGIDRVITATERYLLPAPKFIDDSDFLRVIVYAKKSLIFEKSIILLQVISQI